MTPDRYTELLKALQGLVADLATEATRAALTPGPARAALTAAHRRAEVGGRLEDFAEVAAHQRAVRFVLQTLYVRVLEDLDLLTPRRIKGRWSRRYFRLLAPGLGVAAYLRWALADVAVDFPSLFEDPWAPFPFPSDSAIQKVWDLWHDEDGRGNLRFEWSAEGFDSRFLGDLYQDLDAEVRKHFALLQTPEFVESWILDHTLTPALKVFDPSPSDDPQAGFRLIDPTCGSGHFLVGAFRRLFQLWRSRGAPPWAAAQRALQSVWGCDINPHAVDIARFRLVLEAKALTNEGDIAQLGALPSNLAVMDSLIPWEDLRRNAPLLGGDHLLSRYAGKEERERNAAFLDRAFHVVVGNPPYITPKDVKKRDDYRVFWPDSCHMQYALSAPFAERFFSLGLKPKGDEGDGEGAAFVGQITANSFMKRQFGKALIENVFPQWDLTAAIDTSGAYIPGHGTPTIILFGRCRQPSSEHVWAILGKRGEPKRPERPEEGEVWTAIVAQRRAEDSDSSPYVSSAMIERAVLSQHPWNLTGGDAPRVAALLEESSDHDLESLLPRLSKNRRLMPGRTTVAGEDDLWMYDRLPSGLDPSQVRSRNIVKGEHVRDYGIETADIVLWPYEKPGKPHITQELGRWLSRWKQILAARKIFGRTLAENDRPYWIHLEHYAERLRRPWGITFAFVATHNHFVLDRGGKVFKQSAPVIKLPAHATEDDHFDLLGLLNSSTLCFWMKQMFQNRGYSMASSGARTTAAAWEDFYEHDSTKLKKAPIVKSEREGRVELAAELDSTATTRTEHTPDFVLRKKWTTGSLNATLFTSKANYIASTHKMVALQEELDWHTYYCYGLIDEDLSIPPEQIEPLAPGHRPFEIILARADDKAPEAEKSAWWSRHGHERVTDIPPSYSDAHRARIQARLDRIDSNEYIALLEQPAFKRRWQLPDWDAEVKTACESWLLDRLEALFSEGGPLEEPAPYTLEAITAALRRDDRALEVAEVLEGTANIDLERLVERLLQSNAIPDNPRRLFSPKGLKKYAFWQKVWHLQDLEDAGAPLVDPDTDAPLDAIPVPPKFSRGDFARAEYYKLRGKLNVPRERFIAFDELTPPRYGWNGWRDLQRVIAQVGAVEVVEQDAENPMPVPTADDPRRCGPTLGLWDTLPDLRRWGEANVAQEMEGLAKELCLKSRCPCQVVEFWQKAAKEAGELGKKKGRKRPRKTKAKA